METDVKTKWGKGGVGVEIMVRSHIPGACLVPNFNLLVRGNHLGVGPYLAWTGACLRIEGH